MEHSPNSIQRHVRIYVAVFSALGILTIATVTVSYLRLPVKLAILVALSIATVKSSLVASFFMHLNHERKIIFSILILAAFLFLTLLFLPTLTSAFQN